MKESDTHFQFAPEGKGFVDLPLELSARMWNIVSAVAAGQDGGSIQAEAIHLKSAIDKLLLNAEERG